MDWNFLEYVVVVIPMLTGFLTASLYFLEWGDAVLGKFFMSD